MRDETLARLTENPIRHGMANEAAKLVFVCSCGFRYVGVRRFAVKRDQFGNVEVIDCVKTKVVIVLRSAKTWM
jgi:hypothetical protein